MKKEYGINIKPSLTMARKRFQTKTKVIRYQVDSNLLGIGAGKTYMIKTYGQRMQNWNEDNKCWS